MPVNSLYIANNYSNKMQMRFQPQIQLKNKVKSAKKTFFIIKISFHFLFLPLLFFISTLHSIFLFWYTIRQERKIIHRDEENGNNNNSDKIMELRRKKSFF